MPVSRDISRFFVFASAALFAGCPPETTDARADCACDVGTCPGTTLPHSADSQADFVITLTELLRVIQFFNTGVFSCAEEGTEDGYTPGPGPQDCASHSSDYAPQDWQIDLGELLRLIQFFNTRGYHECLDVATEDGFCPGPALLIPETPKMPIIMGMEYAVKGMGPLAAMGLPGVKPLPGQFEWIDMQPTPDAPINFARLDILVQEFQCAGFQEIMLGLKHGSTWASIDPDQGLTPGTNYAPKPEYEPLYREWVRAIVERYDYDGVDDMDGLRGPVNHIEIGVEYTSYEPTPPADYLRTLQIAYEAAHAASKTVVVSHVAFLTATVFDNDPAPEEYEAAFAAVAGFGGMHPLADLRAILDRPDIFDSVNIHLLLYPYEIPPTVRWLRYEMAQRGYDKPIVVSDTSPSPFAGFGIATTCSGFPNLLATIFLPAVEADRCRLADYFTLLVNKDPATLEWAYGSNAIDMVKKTVLAAAENIKLINTSFMEDLVFNQPGATAGNAGWAGMADMTTILFDNSRIVGDPRPSWYALKQLAGHFGGYDTVERIESGVEHVFLFSVRDEEGNSAPEFWIAWYEPPGLVLPGDAVPETTFAFAAAGSTPVIERQITALGQTVPDIVAYSVVDEVPQIPLGPTPVFILSGI